jgi:hypothetical protein
MGGDMIDCPICRVSQIKDHWALRKFIIWDTSFWQTKEEVQRLLKLKAFR